MKYILAIIFTFSISFSACGNELLSAIESGDMLRINSVLENSDKLNEVVPEHGGFENMTPVVWAIKMKKPEVLKALLEAGANPNSTGGSFNTPALKMVVATSSIQTDMMLKMIELLLDNSADINSLSEDNSGVLHSAAYTARKEVIELLLKEGANKDLKNNDGQTAFDLAKMFGKSEVLPLLK